MTKLIELTITPKGETILQTKGFTGGSCQQASKVMEQALGITGSEQMTGEFYQAEGLREEQQTKG